MINQEDNYISIFYNFVIIKYKNTFLNILTFKWH